MKKLLLFLYCVLSVFCLGAMSEKINTNLQKQLHTRLKQIDDYQKAKNRIRILSHSYGCENKDINKSLGNDSILEMNPCMSGAVGDIFIKIFSSLPFLANLPLGGPTTDEVNDMLQNLESFKIKTNNGSNESPTFASGYLIGEGDLEENDTEKFAFSATETSFQDTQKKQGSYFNPSNGNRNVNVNQLNQNLNVILTHTHEDQRSYFERVHDSNKHNNVNIQQVEKNLKKYSNIPSNIRYNPNKDYTNCKYTPETKFTGNFLEIDIDQMNNNPEYEAARKQFVVKIYSLEESKDLIGRFDKDQMIIDYSDNRSRKDVEGIGYDSLINTSPLSKKEPVKVDNSPLITVPTPPNNNPLITTIEKLDNEPLITPITTKPIEIEYYPMEKPEIGINVRPITKPLADNDSLPIAQKNEEKSQKTIKEFVDDLIEGTEPGNETSGSTTQYIKPENKGHNPNKDFDASKPPKVEDKGNGLRVGYFPDGSKIIVRPGSKPKNGEAGWPTLEIQWGPGGKKKTKLRYPRDSFKSIGLHTEISGKDIEFILKSSSDNFSNVILVNENVITFPAEQNFKKDDLDKIKQFFFKRFYGNNKKHQTVIIDGKEVQLPNKNEFDQFFLSKIIKDCEKETEIKNEKIKRFKDELKKIEEDQKKSTYSAGYKTQTKISDNVSKNSIQSNIDSKKIVHGKVEYKKLDLNLKNTPENSKEKCHILNSSQKETVLQKLIKGSNDFVNDEKNKLELNSNNSQNKDNNFQMVAKSMNQFGQAMGHFAEANKIDKIYEYIDKRYKSTGHYLSKEDQEIFDAILYQNGITVDMDKKKIERTLAFELIYCPDRRNVFENINLSVNTRGIKEPLYDISAFGVFKNVQDRYHQYLQIESKKRYLHAKNVIDESHKKNGVYLNKEYVDILNTVLSINKIHLTEEQRKRIERQLAVNFLINPEYKKVFETTDFTVTKNNNNPNKSAIKNIDDLFISVQQRLPDEYSNFLYAIPGKYKEDFIHCLRKSPHANAVDFIQNDLKLKEQKRRSDLVEKLEKEQWEKQRQITFNLNQKTHNRVYGLLHQINPDVEKSEQKI